MEYSRIHVLPNLKKRIFFYLKLFLNTGITLSMLLICNTCFAQTSVKGRVINQNDKKAIADASIFLSNATVGSKTSADGTFTLNNVKTGKYELVVSILGFATFRQNITVNNNNITLPDIEILPKSINLQEVKIKPQSDPNRAAYYEQFKTEFLGTSSLGKECKILNPQMIDFIFDAGTQILMASTNDFLEIENQALGYRIKYLLTNFTRINKDVYSQTTHYEGYALFENLKGTPAQEKRWQKRRQQVYEGSVIHFFRSALNNRIEEEGFRVLQYANVPNLERPADDLIETKLKLYESLKTKDRSYRDSLSYWQRKSKMQKSFPSLFNFPLKQSDIIKPTNQPQIYALGCEYDALHVTYNKNHNFPKKGLLNHLNDPTNNETTVISFNSPVALIDNNGGVVNPNSISYVGAWGKNRIAELLPVDYEAGQTDDINTNNTAVSGVLDKLRAFDEEHLTEKAYLHFDKPYYAAGDTIYFKAYVALGEEHMPTDLSGVLHADLIDPKDHVGQSIKLKITNGVAWGDFSLPDSLPAGNYRVRAYTNWMLNANEDAHFEKNISVGSVLYKKIPKSSSKNGALNGKPDVQFFPEGGQLLTDVASKVAFKAIDSRGFGLAVQGTIVDNENKEITTLASIHLGMGYFYLTPRQGHVYKAKLAFPDGSQSITNLPLANDKGIVLSIKINSATSALVTTTTSKAYYEENKHKTYALIVYSGGRATTYAKKLDSPAITFTLLKRNLHTGIADVTLFSQMGDPLSERLLFVQNNDQLKISVDNDEETFKARGKVTVRLHVKNKDEEASVGQFSVSITDMGKVPVDENIESNILSNLLLTSELKGYVEQPGYYFNNVTEETLKNLDLVMLTQGFRHFNWKPLLNNNYPPIAYPAEKALSINGTAKNFSGKPVVNGTVSLILPNAQSVLSQQTNDKGYFSFNNLAFTDTAAFILQAVTNSGKNTTKLNYQVEESLPITTLKTPDSYIDAGKLMVPYLSNSKKQQEDLLKYSPRKAILLKEVNVKALKNQNPYPSSSLAGAGHANQVVHREDIEKLGGSLTERLMGKFHGQAINPMNGRLAAELIVIDGVAMPTTVAPGDPSKDDKDRIQLPNSRLPFDINNINANDVETVEMLYGPNASIYGIMGAHGVLVITTRSGGGLQSKDISSVGILPLKVAGFYTAREFYVPKYENNSVSQPMPDQRSTIFWKPDFITDANGNASFYYYNSDSKGTCRLVIEGIDEKGNLGHQVSFLHGR